MNKGISNGDSGKIKVTFGEMKCNDKNNTIEMPPKNAHEKYIEDIKENIVEIVVHKNTREILRKLEAGREGR